MKLSIVVPAFNEEGNLRTLHARLARVAESCADDYEIIFIDDGSEDRTLEVIRELSEHDPRVQYVSFSRNFGHEVASTAGLDRANGDTVVLIDADLQDPPELIPAMLELWRKGAKVVYGQRRQRPGESVVKRGTSFVFYRILNQLTDVEIPHDTGDFRLMDRRVVTAFRQCRENPRFVRGLVSWVGFKQVALPYDRDERHAGETKYDYRKLLRLSVEAITAFSLKPLKLMMWVGMVVVLASVGLTIPVLIDKMMNRLPSGYALLACGIFFMGGVQLMMLGVMAHYIGQIFQRGHNRPLYVIAEETGERGRAKPANGAASEVVLTGRRAETVSGQR